jgi:hypothetical protein
MKNREMVNGLMSSIDSMDSEKFSSYLAEDVTFQFGNTEPVAGSDAVREYVAGFFGAINSLSHTIDTIN